MGSIENILNASKNVFVDENAPVKVTNASYLSAINGFGYILLDKVTKDVSVSLHITSQQEMREDGNIDTGEVLITSQVDLYEQFKTEGNIFIIKYRDWQFIVNRSYNFNKVANTYHYTGEILQNRNKKFVILDENNASSLFLTNSTVQWLEFGKAYKYKIYPSFLTPINLEDTYFTVDVKSTEALSGVYQPADKQLEQYLQDKIRITGVNATLDNLQEFIYKLIEQAEQGQYFGLNVFGNWQQVNDELQRGFSIKSNISKMDLTINYYTKSKVDDIIKYIREATINLTRSN